MNISPTELAEISAEFQNQQYTTHPLSMGWFATWVHGHAFGCNKRSWRYGGCPVRAEPDFACEHEVLDRDPTREDLCKLSLAVLLYLGQIASFEKSDEALLQNLGNCRTRVPANDLDAFRVQNRPHLLYVLVHMPYVSLLCLQNTAHVHLQQWIKFTGKIHSDGLRDGINPSNTADLLNAIYCYEVRNFSIEIQENALE